MTAPLPGMPTRVGDPGVFLCSRVDLEPWERTTSYDVPAPPPRPPAPGRVWLVASICPDCTPARYCSQHNSRNWWLENFRPGGNTRGDTRRDLQKRKDAPGIPHGSVRSI